MLMFRADLACIDFFLVAKTAPHSTVLMHTADVALYRFFLVPKTASTMLMHRADVTNPFCVPILNSASYSTTSVHRMNELSNHAL